MAVNEKILQLLKVRYQKFFKVVDIDKNTGCLKNSPTIKFATYPYIGSKYGQLVKILIIGLDIGSDETHGVIQSFENRRKAIENKPYSKHNTHIAGTCITALFCLKKEFDWDKQWDGIKNVRSYQKALKDYSKLPSSNPLSYIALTNYYKFVTVNRGKRTGNSNRRSICKGDEDKLLLDEIRILKAKIIIFQSREFGNGKHINLIEDIVQQNKGVTVWIAPHPTWHGSHIPFKYIKEFQKYKIKS